jgi:hypothetical protein
MGLVMAEIGSLARSRDGEQCTSEMAQCIQVIILPQLVGSLKDLVLNIGGEDLIVYCKALL